MSEGQEQNALRDQIAHVRARRAAGWRYLLLGGGGVLLLAAIGGGGIWIGVLLSKDAPPEESAPIAVTQSAESVTSPSPDTTPASPSPAPHTPSPVQHLDAVAAARQGQFQAAVRDFERTREFELARIQSAHVPGPRAARARIALNKEKALSAYDDGDVDSAIRLLDNAKREAVDVLRDAKAHYQRHVQAAKAAYADGDAKTARLRITQAREQWPDGRDAKQWEARIAQLPALLAARGNVAEAREAEDIPAEQTALRRLAELDSSDASVMSRLQAIDGQLREQQFLRAIASGWKAVDDTRAEQAMQAFAEAAQQRPQHAETLRLKTGIDALVRSQTRDRHLAAAAQAVTSDDWPVALRAFEEAKALAPTHKDAVDGSLLAARITDAQRAMDDFLSRPERLASPSIAEAARQTLRDAEPLVTHSPRLTASKATLARVIQDRQTQVSVRVLSDNQTEIGIRGVGTIGRLKERVIELRPGAYVFEGKRKGYRSKLLTVNVSHKKGASAEVRVVCDERI